MIAFAMTSATAKSARKMTSTTGASGRSHCSMTGRKETFSTPEMNAAPERITPTTPTSNSSQWRFAARAWPWSAWLSCQIASSRVTASRNNPMEKKPSRYPGAEPVAENPRASP